MVLTLDVVTKDLAMTFSSALSETLRIWRRPSAMTETLRMTLRNAPCHLFHVQTLLKYKLLKGVVELRCCGGWQ